MRLNDVARWEEVAQNPPGWDDRNALLASFVPEGAAVVDLGAGARTLRSYLPVSASYQAVDLVPSDDVIVYDFNRGGVPELPRRYDIAICSGLLEYLVDLDGFMARLPKLARIALFTYAAVVPGQTRAKRAGWGWVNHLSRRGVLDLVERAGYSWTQLGEWRAQIICAAYLDGGPLPVLRQRDAPASQTEWERAFALLADAGTAAAQGHADSAHPAGAEDLDLAAWVDAQRKAWKSGQLERSRARRLAGLPGWQWTPGRAAWNERLAELSSVPPDAPLDDELRSWADDQRRRRRDGELAVPQAAALDAVPGWEWDADEAAWREGLRQLREFAKQRGHTAVPGAFAQNGFDLGAWVRRMRLAHGRGELSPARREILCALPTWGWNDADASWARALKTLAEFVERNGHASIPRGMVESGLDLGAWLARQRDAHAAGALSPEAIADLERFGALEVDPQELRWQEHFLGLRRIAASTGLPDPPAGEEHGELVRWLSEQRALHRRDELDPVRTARLQTLPGFAWDSAQAKWELRLRALIRFAEESGHASPTRDTEVGGQKIGRWVIAQRRAYAAGSLDPDRAARLDALPGWAWTTVAARFERGFAALSAYCAEHGFAVVGEDEPELHAFSAAQRRRYAAGELGAVEALRLNGLNGWTWTTPPAWVLPTLRALGTFVAREGHALVPDAHVEGDVRLGELMRELADGSAERPLDPEIIRILQDHVPWATAGIASGWGTSYSGLVDRARMRPVGPLPSPAGPSREG